MTLPTGYEALLCPNAEQRLSAALRALERGESALTLGTKMRADGVGGDEVATLLGQAGLRLKARSKFGLLADKMLFTPAGLEQASRERVAALHAGRFVAAGCRTVADLGCGIGAESLALAAAGVYVLAVEIDAVTAKFAEHNLGVLCGAGDDSPPFTVITADATEVPLDGALAPTRVDGVFLDPARRTAGHRDTRRLTRPDDYSPSLDFAFGLGERLPTGIKLGPGFDRELIPDHAEAQWVSINGQLVEMGLWFGALARPTVRRSALVMRDDAAHELSAADDAPDVDPRPLASYIYEPDNAVIRARLIGLLATQLNAGMLSDGIAYLTGDELVPTPFARAFRVIEQLPAGEKQLKRALAARDIGRLEIKKRGANVDPAALRKRLNLKGDGEATLVMTRAAGKHTALLVERV